MQVERFSTQSLVITGWSAADTESGSFQKKGATGPAVSRIGCWIVADG